MINNLSSCCCDELCGLDGQPKTVMLKFCRLVFDAPPRTRWYVAPSTKHLHTRPHYVFHDGVYNNKSAESNGGKFAAFILKHKLGLIGTTVPATNKMTHPDRQAQAWIWTPDEDALFKWYTAHKADAPTPVEIEEDDND